MPIDEVRLEVERLAHEPTYEHLITYTEKVRPYLQERDIRWMDESIHEIEEAILNGQSIRKTLSRMQIERNGGFADTGIMPYISAATDPELARGYSRGGGIMVIDIPISKLEEVGAFGKGETEVCIKGVLDAQYITAVIVGKDKLPSTFSPEKSAHDMQMALHVIPHENTLSFLDDDLDKAREEKHRIDKSQDLKQWEYDAEQVGKKRLEELLMGFPEFTKVVQNLQQAAIKKNLNKSVLVYKWLQRSLFDSLENRLGKIGTFGYNLNELGFNDNDDLSSSKSFDRSKISNAMLFALREQVERLEKRHRERK